MGGLSGGGSLLQFQLQGFGVGSDSLAFTRCDLNEGAIACIANGGMVTVVAPTPTVTSTPTLTLTPTVTLTATLTATITATPTKTPTATPTRTWTPSATPTQSFTPSQTLTPSLTPTRTQTRTLTSTRTFTPLPEVHLSPILSPIVIGGSMSLSGSGFTAGSRVVLFIATPTGVQAFGPLTRDVWATGFGTSSPTIPLGNGFGTVVVVNTDQGFIQSNPQSQYLVRRGPAGTADHHRHQRRRAAAARARRAGGQRRDGGRAGRAR